MLELKLLLPPSPKVAKEATDTVINTVVASLRFIKRFMEKLLNIAVTKIEINFNINATTGALIF